ncbi:hypothetical protein YC2023_014091 [Brassica napus]
MGMAESVGNQWIRATCHRRNTCREDYQRDFSGGGAPPRFQIYVFRSSPLHPEF